jgi:hypothetical protein
MATSKGKLGAFPPLSAVVFSSKALRVSVPWGLTLLFWTGCIALAVLVLKGAGI